MGLGDLAPEMNEKYKNISLGSHRAKTKRDVTGDHNFVSSIIHSIVSYYPFLAHTLYQV